MNRKEHCKSCEAAFGNSFAEVHDFLDRYSEKFPREHRELYHHRQGLALIAERFGSEAVKAAERHIIEDEGFVPEDHSYYHTENKELIRMIEKIYGASNRPVETPKKKRSWKVYVLRAIIAGNLLAFATAGWLARSVHETGRLAAAVCVSGITPGAAIEELGGQERAARRLAFYLSLPDWAASHKDNAWVLLLHCGKSTVPFLVQCLTSPDDNLRYEASSVLSRMGPAASEAIPALEEALSDSQKMVRYCAVQGLGNIGPAAKGSAASVERLFADSDGTVRTRALLAYYQITGDGDKVAPGLAQELSDPDRMTSGFAAMWIPGIGPSAAQTVPSLVKALESSPHKDVRGRVVKTLGEIGPAAKSAVPALEVRLAKTKGFDRFWVASSIWKITGDVSKSVPVLIELLSDENKYLRSATAITLGEIGPQAVSATSALVLALRDTCPDVRSEAAEALGRIGPGAKATLPNLRKALDDHERWVRFEAALAIWRLAGESGPVLEEFEQAMANEEWFVQYAALKRISEMGTSAKTALPQIKEMLEHDNSFVRKAAAEALKKIKAAQEKSE